MLKKSLSLLTDGSTVAIIGGGPGGVACSITLINLAREKGIQLQVVLYESKTYSGDPRYNQCVGVLSPPIRSLLEDHLMIRFPDHLIQRQIDGYVLHSEHKQIDLKEESDKSLVVSRIAFDDYLLKTAVEKGVEVRTSRVTDVEIDQLGVSLYTENDFLRADAVVGAFGMDDGSIRMFQRSTPYRGPDFLNSIVTKLSLSPKLMAQIPDRIFTFLPRAKQIEFAAVTPKREHFTINIAGKGVSSITMQQFLSSNQIFPLIGEYLPAYLEKLEFFKGRFPVSLAKHFFDDRYVMIGDAAGLVRPFKGKGINSAIRSGFDAAQVLISAGYSRRALRTYRQLCHETIHDMPYGHFMRRFAIFIAKNGLIDRVIDLAERNKRVREALFNSVSAHKFYHVIIRDLLQWSVIRDSLKYLLSRRRVR